MIKVRLCDWDTYTEARKKNLRGNVEHEFIDIYKDRRYYYRNFTAKNGVVYIDLHCLYKPYVELFIGSDQKGDWLEEFIKRNKRWEFFTKTSDNFYPNYANNHVSVSYGENHDGTYRVSVWGNDDLGLDKVFKDENEAINVFESLRGTVITIEGLRKAGFLPA